MAQINHPEWEALAQTRAMLKDSIAKREEIGRLQSADFRAGTVGEKRRLAEVEARMKEIDADAFKQLDASAPVSVDPEN